MRVIKAICPNQTLDLSLRMIKEDVDRNFNRTIQIDKELDIELILNESKCLTLQEVHCTFDIFIMCTRTNETINTTSASCHSVCHLLHTKCRAHICSVFHQMDR